MIIKSTEGWQGWEAAVLTDASRAFQGNWGKIRSQDDTEKFLPITGRRNFWPSATQPVQRTGAGGALCTPFYVACVTLLSSVSDRSDTHIFISHHGLDRPSITSLESTNFLAFISFEVQLEPAWIAPPPYSPWPHHPSMSLGSISSTFASPKRWDVTL